MRSRHGSYSIIYTNSFGHQTGYLTSYGSPEKPGQRRFKTIAEHPDHIFSRAHLTNRDGFARRSASGILMESMRYFLLFLPLLASCASDPHEPRYVMAPDTAQPGKPRINPASYNPNTAYRAGGFGSSPIRHQPTTSRPLVRAPRPANQTLPPTSSTTPRMNSLARDSAGNLNTIKPNAIGGYTVRDSDGDVRTITPRAGGGYAIREKGGTTRIVSKLPSGNTAYEQ